MKRHSTFYSPHAVAKALAIRHQSYKGTDVAHIIQNAQVREVNIEQDLVRWSAEDSKLYWTSRRRQTPTAVPKVVVPPSATSVTVHAYNILLPVFQLWTTTEGECMAVQLVLLWEKRGQLSNISQQSIFRPTTMHINVICVCSQIINCQ